MEKHDYFEYKEKGKPIYFHRTKEDQFICWKCGNNYKSIVRHIKFKESCRGKIDIDQFKMEFREYRIDKTRKKTNSRVKKCTDKKREQLGDKYVKAGQNARNKKFISKRREELGDTAVKNDQNSRNKKSIDKKKEQLGDASVKNDQNKRKTKSIDKKRVELGPVQLKKETKERQSNWRKRKAEEEPEQLKKGENKRKRLSLKRLRV